MLSGPTFVSEAENHRNTPKATVISIINISVNQNGIQDKNRQKQSQQRCAVLRAGQVNVQLLWLRLLTW